MESTSPLIPRPRASRASRSRVISTGPVVALVVVACAGSDETLSPLESVARDSAGITIIDNQAPAPGSRLDWKVEDAPSLSIGSIGGNPQSQLFGVADALRAEDGVILVANSGSAEVKVFDASGEYVESWGREGEGPGEFLELTNLMRWPGDSVMAWDFRQRRATIYAVDGTLGRTLGLVLSQDRGPGTALAVFPDGTLLASSQISWASQERIVGIVRRARDYALIDPNGNELVDLGRHEDEEFYIRGDVGAIMRHPFRRRMHATVWQDQIVLAPSDRYEIPTYSRHGELRWLVRRDHELAPVTQADVDAHLEARLAEADPGARDILRELSSDYPVVETFPAFSQLIVDATGHLWVKEYVRPDDEESVWTVFDPDGRVQGLVETPAGLLVFEIGADYILGRATDELEVEYVQLWGLARAAPYRTMPDGPRRRPPNAR